MQQKLYMQPVVHTYTQKGRRYLQSSLVLVHQHCEFLLLSQSTDDVSVKRCSDEVSYSTCCTFKAFIIFVKMSKLKFIRFIAQQKPSRLKFFRQQKKLRRQLRLVINLYP